MIAGRNFKASGFNISASKEIPGIELRYDQGKLEGEISYPQGQSITVNIGLSSSPGQVIINGQSLGAKSNNFSITVQGTRKDAYINRLYKPYNEYYANSFKSTLPPEPELEPEDLDGNGVVNISDIQLWVRVFLGIETNSSIRGRADIDKNGSLNIADIQKVINRILRG